MSYAAVHASDATIERATGRTAFLVTEGLSDMLVLTGQLNIDSAEAG